MFRKFSLSQIVLFIFGIFALWSGISYLRDNMDLAENGEVVEALITHIEVFEYRNDDNEIIECDNFLCAMFGRLSHILRQPLPYPVRHL